MGGERPKGYMDWNPKQESLDLLADVKEILTQERAELPVTARYLFYKLVALKGFPKTENDYGRLCNMLVKARRAQMIPFSSIRDDKANTAGGDYGYDSVEDFWETLRESGKGYSRLAREGQPIHIELWSEGNSPVPTLARAAREFGVPVTGTGGFPGVTLVHRLATQIVQRDIPTVWLHIGDYDPSGESIFDSMKADVYSFVVGQLMPDFDNYEEAIAAAREKFRAERIGLTWDQVLDYEIETAPPKKSDTRSRRWEEEGRFESAQLEAVDAQLLKQWVREACERHTDMDLLREVEAKADDERERIIEGMEELFENFEGGE